MTGTEKQIAWATTIRASWIAQAQERIAKFREREASGSKAATLRIAEAEAFIAVVESIEDAPTIIDTRNRVRDLLCVSRVRGFIARGEQSDLAEAYTTYL
jgi:hypothetical protein